MLGSKDSPDADSDSKDSSKQWYQNALEFDQRLWHRSCKYTRFPVYGVKLLVPRGGAAMKSKFLAAFVLIVGLLIVSAPLLAHHGAAAFENDPAKRVTVKGTVVEWFWANPHC